MKRRVGWIAFLFLVSFAMPTVARQKTQSRSAAVDAVFVDFSGKAPSASVMVIQNGRTVLKRSYGYADLERKKKANPKTAYRLASVSKQFTATAILLLVEAGKLSLDDDLIKLLPGFPAYGRGIRVRHLLNHTSGLLAYEDLMSPSLKEPVLDKDVLEIIKKQEKTYFPPGTKFRYSNSGYALLACIVERLSGMPYSEFLKGNIFIPLRMNSTFLNLKGATKKNRAFGYTRREGNWVRTDQSMTSFVLGDGGIYSSLEDFQKWEAALASAKLLRKNVLDETMTASTTGDEDGPGYGFGWYVGKVGEERAVWHGGSSVGFRNHFLRIPGKALAVLVLTNRNDAEPSQLARRVAEVFSQ